MEHDNGNSGLEVLARREAYTERPLPLDILDIVDMVDVCPFKRKKRRGGAPSEIIIHQKAELETKGGSDAGRSANSEDA